jgi:hypothetical protein
MGEGKKNISMISFYWRMAGTYLKRVVRILRGDWEERLAIPSVVALCKETVSCLRATRIRHWALRRTDQLPSG